MYESAKKAGKQNEYVAVGGKFSDHTVVTVDPVMGSVVMKNVIKFFNRLVEEKEQKQSESSFSFWTIFVIKWDKNILISRVTIKPM